MLKVFSFILEVFYFIGNLLLFLSLFAFFLITYPVIVLVIIFSLFSNHYINKTRQLARTINNFQFKNVPASLEKVLTSMLEIKLHENSQVPLEYILAYLYLSKGPIYEINSKNNTLNRIFMYNSKADCIKVTMFMETHDVTLSLLEKTIPDLDDKYFIYLNYKPHYVK